MLSFTHAAVAPLWSDLDLTVHRGEFIAVLGPNGVGKSTLLHTVLGTRALTAGEVRTDARIGYIPQQRMFEDIPVRARDLVDLALNHKPAWWRRKSVSGSSLELLESVGALGLADRRVGSLSGGQQQLIRQAQALACDPELLLCDEPLLSLDLNMQEKVVGMLAERRQTKGTAILFVTHSINPVLQHVDRVLYLGPHGHRIGSVEEVMTSESLSELYGSKVTVVRVDDRLVVL